MSAEVVTTKSPSGDGELRCELVHLAAGNEGAALPSVIASLLLTTIPEGLHALGEGNLRLLVYGTMVLFVLWFLPNGLGGLIDRVGATGRAR